LHRVTSLPWQRPFRPSVRPFVRRVPPPRAKTKWPRKTELVEFKSPKNRGSLDKVNKLGIQLISFWFISGSVQSDFTHFSCAAFYRSFVYFVFRWLILTNGIPTKRLRFWWDTTIPTLSSSAMYVCQHIHTHAFYHWLISWLVGRSVNLVMYLFVNSLICWLIYLHVFN